MSEATVAEVPQEVKDKLEGQMKTLEGQDHASLIAYIKEASGEEFKVEDTNPKWALRKAKRVAQAALYKEAGIEAPAPEAQAEAAEKSEKKPGRKKMNITGNFKIVLAEGQTSGRDGSWKHAIVEKVKEMEKFSYEEFQVVVAETSGWSAENEIFETRSTKFKDLNAATRAWFSELKNKQEIIVPAE